MINAEFYKLISCIAHTATTWLHEGVTSHTSGDRGTRQVSEVVIARFCESIWRDLAEIEEAIGSPHSSFALGGKEIPKSGKTFPERHSTDSENSDGASRTNGAPLSSHHSAPQGE
jgi:hypothetical protein